MKMVRFLLYFFIVNSRPTIRL